MKYFLILFFNIPLLLVSVLCQAQTETIFNYKVSYQLKYKPDSTRTSFVNQEKMVLYVGDEFSKFSSWGSHVADSLNRYEKGNLSFSEFMALLPETDFTYTVYKNIPANKLSFVQKLTKTQLMYQEPLANFQWKLGSETKKILAYNCRKAYTTYEGRNYIAWFTTEIPISEGPYKFSGLPGLIVEIHDAKNDYSFSLVGFEKLKEEFLYEFDAEDYLLTDKKAVIKAEQKFHKDPFLALNQGGIQIGFKSEEQKERMRKEYERNQQSRNNPIELVAVDE